MSADNPIEPKVVAAITGAGGGAAVATFLDYVIGVTIYGADATANAGADAVAKVPAPVTGIIAILLAAIGAGVLGYRAPKAIPPAAPIQVVTVTPSGVTPVVSDLSDPDSVGAVPPVEQDTDIADHEAAPDPAAPAA